MIQRVGESLSVHLTINNVDFYICRRLKDDLRYVTVKTTDLCGIPFIKIYSMWTFIKEPRLWEATITHYYRDKIESREVINRYLFLDYPFPRFASVPYKGARIQMEFVKQISDGEIIKNSRDIYPFMVLPKHDARRPFLTWAKLLKKK